MWILKKLCKDYKIFMHQNKVTLITFYMNFFWRILIKKPLSTQKKLKITGQGKAYAILSQQQFQTSPLHTWSYLSIKMQATPFKEATKRQLSPPVSV